MNSREAGVKISIVLPKELHVRLQRHRPRIRATRTCQEALELALRREECRAAAEPNEVAGLIARLRVEKENIERQDRATGFRDGRTRSFQFRYTDFKLFERISDTIKRYGQGAKAEEILSSVLEDHGRDFLELFGSEEPSVTNRENYLRGYIEGVAELWSEISEKL